MDSRSWVIPSVDEVCQLIGEFVAYPKFIKDEDFKKHLLGIKSEFEKISALKKQTKLLRQQLDAHKQPIIDSTPALKEIEKQMRRLYDEMENLSNKLCDNLYQWSQLEKYANKSIILYAPKNLISTTATSSTTDATTATNSTSTPTPTTNSNNTRSNLRTISLSDVLYKASLTLARLNPRNTNDFGTNEEIDDIDSKNIIVTSDRYLYDLDSLSGWLSREVSNPYTRGVFRPRDLKMVCACLLAKKGISINLPHVDVTLPQPTQYDLGNVVNQMQQLARQPQPQVEPAPYSPRVQLPDFFAENLFAQLENGHLAVATYRNNNPQNHQDHVSEIMIMDPANNFAVVRRILDPGRISGMRALANGNIVVGHYYAGCQGMRNHNHCTLNIYHPETGERVNTSPLITQGVDDRLMLCRGNEIIFTGATYFRGIQRYNLQTAVLEDLNIAQMSMNSLVAVGNNLAVFGTTQNHHDEICVVYNEYFAEISRFQYSGCANKATTLDHARVALADENCIRIYDVLNGVMVNEFNHAYINVIHSIATLENGNILLAGSSGWIQEYTQQGVCVGEAKTNIGYIDSPLALRLAYNIIVARNALRVPAPASVAPAPPNAAPVIINTDSLQHPNTLFRISGAERLILVSLARVAQTKNDFSSYIPETRMPTIIAAARGAIPESERLDLGMPVQYSDSNVGGFWSNKFDRLGSLIPEPFAALRCLFAAFVAELSTHYNSARLLLLNRPHTQFALAGALILGVHLNNRELQSLSADLILAFQVQRPICDLLNSAFAATPITTVRRPSLATMDEVD